MCFINRNFSPSSISLFSPTLNLEDASIIPTLSDFLQQNVRIIITKIIKIQTKTRIPIINIALEFVVQSVCVHSEPLAQQWFEQQ